jgi:hypothetical protein
VLGAGLELEIVAPPDRLPALARALTVLPGRPAVARALVFDEGGFLSSMPSLAAARAAFASAGIECPIGGGTRSDFVHINRATLPLPLMDLVCYAVNPQVHTFDNASLVETLAVQAVTVRDARRLSGGRPVAVGPMTLRRHVNPDVVAPAAGPEPGDLPPQVDPRQMSLFAAAWTAGSLRALADAGAAALTYFETTGWLGVMEREAVAPAHSSFRSTPSMLFPLSHVLADVGAFAAAAGGPTNVQILSTTTSAPLAATALALRAGSRLLLLVANLTNDPQSVALTLPPISTASIRILDETTFAPAVFDPGFRSASAPLALTTPDFLTLDLLPYAVATIRAST